MERLQRLLQQDLQQSNAQQVTRCSCAISVWVLHYHAYASCAPQLSKRRLPMFL